jgi:hypothetical protein
MADDDAALAKSITDNIEAMYQALRSAASNIAGLLSVGVATCDEVRAYNLWALACYNTQRGMLASARAAGQNDLPELPQTPTLFTWRGVDGAAALNIDCAGEEQSLSGVMGRALKGPTPKSVYLSTKDIAINTTDAFALQPQNSPTFATLANVQLARSQQVQGLGTPVTLILIIAGVAFAAISVAIVAIMSYLKSSDIQKSQTDQVKLQAEAFANYTSARLTCLSQCTAQGGANDACVDQCKKIVDKPNIKLPDNPFSSEWGILQWTGFTVLAGGVAWVAYRAYERRKAGRPIFELPSAHHEG